MNSTILKNGVTIFNIFMASTFIFWTIGCQSDDELESVNNSSVVACTSELEDFIIAATDLQQSLIVFEKELIKVNFADLETEINADGNKVTHLPAIIRSLNIEQKILLMNQKKDALRNKYPQFASMDFNEISGNVQNLYERVTQLDESSMTNWIINMSMAISEKLRSTRNSTSRRIITDAQNIVKDRYMEPALSLDDVCADLGVSNSYFSSIFKKETGQSFVSYLTDYRMDRAEEMVLNTDEKSYKIAEKVGYQDANYFSYVFKRQFGVSPSKYRTAYEKNEK